MGQGEKKSYLNEIRLRYRIASKLLKKKILDEFCIICNYHRKHAIRLLGASFRKIKYKRKRGSKPVYDQNMVEPLIKIWLATNQMCSKKLKVALPLWLPFYKDKLPEVVRNKLLSVSSSTIDRLLNLDIS